MPHPYVLFKSYKHNKFMFNSEHFQYKNELTYDVMIKLFLQFLSKYFENIIKYLNNVLTFKLDN